MVCIEVDPRRTLKKLYKFSNCEIIPMHICRKSRTHILPTRRVVCVLLSAGYSSDWVKRLDLLENHEPTSYPHVLPTRRVVCVWMSAGCSSDWVKRLDLLSWLLWIFSSSWPRVGNADSVRACWYGVATTSRLLKIIGLFCKRAL